MTRASTLAGAARTRHLMRRYLDEYARRPLNVVLLLVVPVGFVTLSAGAIADFADVLGGLSDLGTIEAATAGWAAALLAGIAGFFHVTGSRDTDRRLAAAGMGASSVVGGRLLSALVLAAAASFGALIALALRTGIVDAPKVVGVTILMAITYLGIGATVGSLVRSEINGSLIVVFVWMFDVFFGPAMGGEAGIIRLFPLHFPTLVVTDVASGHAGPIGDLGISALWAAVMAVVAVVALTATTKPARSAGRRRAAGPRRAVTALRFGFRDYRRNAVLWVLLVGIPIAFITLSIAVTPDDPAPVSLTEGGRTSLEVLTMSDLHGAIMVPITVGFLTGLAGLFVTIGSTQGDRRLVLAGYRPAEVLVARFGVIAAAAALTTAVSIAVTSRSFEAQNWPAFAVANLLVALTYGMIGVLVGPRFGLLGGLYVMLALPFIDIGIGQNAMFDAAPPAWAAFMPASGAVSMVLDAAFTPTLDDTMGIGIALVWLAGITLAAAAQFHRLAAPRR